VTKIKIDASDLWGKLAGDDEDIEVLDNFFVNKSDLFATFRNPRVSLRIVQSRKGMGKSALLRKIAHEKRSSDDSPVVIEATGSDFDIQIPERPDPEALIRTWKQRIARKVFAEVGSQLGLAISDDDVRAVEEAELQGRKAGSLLKVVLDRFTLSFGQKGVVEATLRTPASEQDVSVRIARMQQNVSKRVIWLFVDDIDATYIGTDGQRLKISTFISACRNLCNSISGLCVRTSVRTDVWTDIQDRDEAMDKAAEYVFDLSWSEDEIRQILAERIRGYCRRHSISLDSVAKQQNYNGDRHSLRMVFTDPWRTQKQIERGGTGFPAHVRIHELSYGRPRWATQLCRRAATNATKQNREQIALEDVVDVLEAFGRDRVDDLIREHRHECPEVSELIQAFVDQPARLNTDQLMLAIHNRILNHLKPRIDGTVVEIPTPIAHFLYRIGFLVAVFDGAGEREARHLFESRPNLLKLIWSPENGHHEDYYLDLVEDV